MWGQQSSRPFMAESLAVTPPPAATTCTKALLKKRLTTSGPSFSSKICPNEETTRRWFWCFLGAWGGIEPGLRISKSYFLDLYFCTASFKSEYSSQPKKQALSSLANNASAPSRSLLVNFSIP